MLRWDPAEVEAADAQPWDMPLAHAMRPVSLRTMAQVGLAGGALYALIGVTLLVFVMTTDDLGERLVDPQLLGSVGGFAATTGAALIAAVALLSVDTLRRLFPTIVLVGVAGGPVATSLSLYASGPAVGDFATVIYLEAPLFAFYVCRLRWAMSTIGLVLVGYGLVLGVQDGWAYPSTRWIIVASTVGATAFLVGGMAKRAAELADAEHAARVELAELNQTLEGRVDDQVTEIERLGELRRFLSPQVADALLSDQQAAVRRPHRARIAVFFCDLRGFTAFTNKAEPEEVFGVLDEYYKTVGTLLQKYGATVGDYAGDGIMAYFGDPVPHPEPAHAALRMTSELVLAMGAAVSGWRRHGHDLDYGVGVSFGYATLGVIGFDGRYDYSPIGGVVNLAARLCAKAGPGEVLLDHATYAATDGLLPCEPVELDLKGYTDPRAYRVL